MLNIPLLNASDDEWHAHAQRTCEALAPHLADYLAAHFSYKPRYVKQSLNPSFSTISAFTLKYDLYFRAFPRPDEFWPRESITIARIMFKERRSGHGRALIEMLVNLAPEFGYKFLTIESANKNAAAFARQMGFTPFDKERHWIGSIPDIQRALTTRSEICADRHKDLPPSI